MGGQAHALPKTLTTPIGPDRFAQENLRWHKQLRMARAISTSTIHAFRFLHSDLSWQHTAAAVVARTLSSRRT